MFKTESFENEIYEQLEINMSNQVGIVKNASNKKNVLLIKLCSIANKLDEMNFGKEAEAVTKLLEVFSASETYNHGFEKLADEEFLEGSGEHKREKAEENFEDDYLNILLGDGNYDKTFDELTKNHVDKEQKDDFLKVILSIPHIFGDEKEDKFRSGPKKGENKFTGNINEQKTDKQTIAYVQ